MNFEELIAKPVAYGEPVIVDLIALTGTLSRFYDFLTKRLELQISATKFYDLIASANSHRSGVEIMQRLAKLQLAPNIAFVTDHEAIVILNHYGFDLNIDDCTITDMRKLQNVKGGD